jgi:hypothetical protein
MNTATAHIPRSVTYTAPAPPLNAGPAWPDIPGGINRATVYPAPANAPHARGKDFS